MRHTDNTPSYCFDNLLATAEPLLLQPEIKFGLVNEVWLVEISLDQRLLVFGYGVDVAGVDHADAATAR